MLIGLLVVRFVMMFVLRGKQDTGQISNLIGMSPALSSLIPREVLF